MSLKSLIKKNPVTYRLARGLLALTEPLLAGWMRLCHALYGIEDDKIYFSCFNGVSCTGNPRAVAEALHARAPELRLVFRLNRRHMNDADIPAYIERVPQASLRGLREMATARVLVKNQCMRPWMRKFPDQYYVQTWHGDRGFKKVQLAAYPNRKSYQREADYIDLAVSGSDFGTRVFRDSFRIKGDIIAEGCPRNDRLVHPRPGDYAAARAALGLKADERALLYAPTFRNADTGGAQEASVDLTAVRSALEAATGEKWVCLVRSHELCSGMHAEGARDVSDFTDTTTLLLAVDYLITDYSSIGGDFMLLGRPCVYYQPDRHDYDLERGLAFDPDASPLCVAHDLPELMHLISSAFNASDNCRAVLAFFKTHETGHAAEAVAERILKEIGRNVRQPEG